MPRWDYLDDELYNSNGETRIILFSQIELDHKLEDIVRMTELVNKGVNICKVARIFGVSVDEMVAYMYSQGLRGRVEVDIVQSLKEGVREMREKPYISKQKAV